MTICVEEKGGRNRRTNQMIFEFEDNISKMLNLKDIERMEWQTSPNLPIIG